MKNSIRKWEMIENIIEQQSHRTKPYKIGRDELFTILKNMAVENNFHDVQAFVESKQLTIDELNHSLLVFDNKIIRMDHNSRQGDYKERYLGFGKFGKVKLGKDKEEIHYAIKIEKSAEINKNDLESNIMSELGALIGRLERKTNSNKLWMDGESLTKKKMTVMKYVEGTPLDLVGLTPLQNSLAALALLKTLNHLNTKGIAHFDISPSNVLINMAQFPPELTTKNIESYILDALEGHKFSDLIQLIDWGMACKIPTNGKETTYPKEKIGYSLTKTAPETYVHDACSAHSQSYTISKFIKEYFNVTTNSIIKASPFGMDELVTKYERILIQEKNKPLVDVDQNKERQLQDSKYKYEMKIKEELQKTPPSSRPSLECMFQDLFAEIKTSLKLSKKRKLYELQKNWPSDTVQSESVYYSAGSLSVTNQATVNEQSRNVNYSPRSPIAKRRKFN